MDELEGDRPIPQEQQYSKDITILPQYNKSAPAETAFPKVYSPRGERWAKMLKGKKYQSTNHLADIEKEKKEDGVSLLILNAAKRYEVEYHTPRIGRHSRRPADVERYFLWLYVTGSRMGEPFLKPYPVISIMKPKDMPWKIIKVTRPIEKAFEKGTREHELIEQNIPVFDQTEEEIWRIVLDDYQVTDIDDLFERMSKRFYSRKTGKRMGSLTKVIQHNFRADMRTEKGRLIEGAPISPHALRHHRAYSLLLQRGMPEKLVISLFGWREDKMLYRYAYMSREIKGQAQYQSLKNYASERKHRQEEQEKQQK